MAHDEKLAELERRRAKALGMGGERKLAARRNDGVLNARERLDYLQAGIRASVATDPDKMRSLVGRLEGLLEDFGGTGQDMMPHFDRFMWRVNQIRRRVFRDPAVPCLGLHADAWRLRDLQTALVRAGLVVVDSFVSITELSEYAAGVPDEMKQMRLYPELPPAGKAAWCFYPMTKRREAEHNWYRLPFDERKELMFEHGTSGRQFAGRIVQLITASTGLDDWEWGVTLFGVHLDDLKDTVYTMRYDTASAVYAEFGPFYTGLVAPVDEILARLR